MELTESIVFIRLSFKLPGRDRQVESGAAAAELGAQRERVKTSAKLYSGEAFAAITAADALAKSALLNLAIQIPTDFRGAYVLPRALLERAELQLREAFERRAGLVNSFVDTGAYAAERERARRELGSAFDPSDYPAESEIRGKFGMSWRYFAFDVPADLPAEVRERETAKLQAEIGQVAADCRQALREGLAELVTHLVDRLSPDANGRKKRLAATTVTGLREFLDTLSARDITGDTQIRELGERAKQVLGGISADDLRESRSAADRIRAGLAEIGQQVGALAKTSGARKFDFSADETAPAAAPADTQENTAATAAA